MLAAFVKEWHNYIYTVCLSCRSGDNTLQILIVIIRWHMIDMSVYCVCQAVVADIHHNKEIFSADTFAKHSLCFPRTKTWATVLCKIRICFIRWIDCRIQKIMQRIFAERYDVLIHFFCQILAAFQGSNFKWCCRKSFFHKFDICHEFLLIISVLSAFYLFLLIFYTII